MEFDSYALDTVAMFKLAIGSVVPRPRPIAWASSVDGASVRAPRAVQLCRGTERRYRTGEGGLERRFRRLGRYPA